MNYGKKGTADKQKALTSKSTMMRKKFGVIFFKSVIIVVLALIVTIACAGFGIFKGLIDSAPDISNIDVSPSGFSTTVYAADGTELTKLVASGANRVYKKISDIPKHLQYAFVSIEDERFYEHKGIDVRGILRAGVTGISSGAFSEGASTITQQLLKNNVFSNWTNENSFFERMERKVQEQYLAIQLEKNMSKELIMENYLNTINLGQNTLGVQAASHRYFNKDVSELTISESAAIAAITQNPSRYNPVTSPEENAKRRKKVLGNMLEQGYISQAEYDTAMNDDVYSRIQIVNTQLDVSSVYTYFIDELTEQVIDDLREQKGYTQTQAYNALYSGGLSIYTTQDLAIQAICDEEFNNPANFPAGSQVTPTYRLSVQKADGSVEHYSELTMLRYFSETVDANYTLLYANEEEALAAVEKYKNAVIGDGDTILENGESISFIPQPQASVVIMDQYTGAVRAVVGGRGQKEGSLTLNRATNTTRQPGSTFKVLASFAPALDTAGMTLASVQDDAPFNYVNKRPVNNWYKGYKGLSTIREGIVRSMNIVAVKTITDITPQLGFEYLTDFGFTTLVDNLVQEDGTVLSDINQSLALGGITKGITNLEITAAYASIANAGTYTKPVFYTKILDHDGKVLIDNTPETYSVLKETTAYLLTSAMQGVVNAPGGTGGTANFGTMPIAGKTGTATNSANQDIDIWFCAYTPYYTCSVWGGYDTNEPLKNTDTSYHLTLWRSIMSRIHENMDRKEFVVPDGIVTATVCKKSGKLAVAGLCDHDPRGSMAIVESFSRGTVPTDVCDRHVNATICSDSKQLATDYCPAHESLVCISRPGGSVGTTDDSAYALPTESCSTHTEKTPPAPSPDSSPSQPADPSAPDSTGSRGSTPSGSSSTSSGNSSSTSSPPGQQTPGQQTPGQQTSGQ